MNTSRLIFPAWFRSSSRAKIIFTSENYLRILVISMVQVILRNVSISNFRRRFRIYMKIAHSHIITPYHAWVNSTLSCVCKYVESRSRPGLDRASKSRKNSCHSFQELIKNHAGTAGRSFGLPAQYGNPTANASDRRNCVSTFRRGARMRCDAILYHNINRPLPFVFGITLYWRK